MELQFQNVYQQVENWYVLDSELPWDVKRLRDDLFSLIEVCKTPVIFVIRVMRIMCFYH